MALLTIKGVLAALLGNGWKSISLGLLLATVGMSLYAYTLRQHVAPQQVLQEQLKDTAKRVQAVGQDTQTTTARARKSTEKLNHVLETHKNWADVPVPDGVVNELCSKIDCDSGTGEVSTPDGKSKDSRRFGKRSK